MPVSVRGGHWIVLSENSEMQFSFSLKPALTPALLRRIHASIGSPIFRSVWDTGKFVFDIVKSLGEQISATTRSYPARSKTN
jgi:hypothetical protein